MLLEGDDGDDLKADGEHAEAPRGDGVFADEANEEEGEEAHEEVAEYFVDDEAGGGVVEAEAHHEGHEEDFEEGGATGEDGFGGDEDVFVGAEVFDDFVHVCFD